MAESIILCYNNLECPWQQHSTQHWAVSLVKWSPPADSVFRAAATQTVQRCNVMVDIMSQAFAKTAA